LYLPVVQYRRLWLRAKQHFLGGRRLGLARPTGWRGSLEWQPLLRDGDRFRVRAILDE